VDPEFWHERWARGEIGFHQSEFNAHMQEYMQLLGIASGANILVPLCGKSRDMLWLKYQGFRVTGIEISQKAIGDFFAENDLVPEVDSFSDALRYRSDGLEIWCANFFRLESSRLPTIDAVYDRAALVALPRAMRVDYANRMASLLAHGTPVLLVTTDYAEHEKSGPPFPVTPAEVMELFGAEFEVVQVHSENCLEREPRFVKQGLTRMDENVHVLRKHRDQTRN